MKEDLDSECKCEQKALRSLKARSRRAYFLVLRSTSEISAGIAGGLCTLYRRRKPTSTNKKCF